MSFVFNPNWQVSAWYIDPINGSDGYTGTNSIFTSGITGPLKTWAELQGRWGTISPRLRQTTTITFMSSHLDNTDPVYFSPFIENGAIISIQGTTPTAMAAVFTLSAVKNRTAGSNSLLAGSFSAGTPAAGVLVQNTTSGKSSRAFIYKNVSGSIWSLTQPLVPLTVPNASADSPTLVDTWASTDTVNILSMVSINIAYLAPVLVDSNVAKDNYFYLYQLNVYDPLGNGDDQCYITGNVQLQEVLFDRALNYTASSIFVGNNSIGTSSATNCFYNVAGVFIFGGNPGYTSIDLSGGGTNGFTSVVNSFVGFDYVAGGAGFNLSGNSGVGNCYQDCTIRVEGGSNVGFGGGNIIYGNSGKTIAIQGNGRIYTFGSTFTTTFTTPFAVSTGIQLNGTSTGYSNAGTNPVITYGGITTTVANLDAAASASGFGGLAYNPGGGILTNQGN